MIEEDPQRDLGERRDFLLDVVVLVVVVEREGHRGATLASTENWGGYDSQQAQATL